MKKQYVYLGVGVDIYMAEHIRRWLSRRCDTVYTTDHTILKDISNTSLICIPDGDVTKLTESINQFLVTFCGGSHALAKTYFYDLVHSSVKFVRNNRNGTLSSNSLSTARLTTEITSNILLFNTTHVPLCTNNNPINEVSCYSCCDSCKGDHALRRASMYYVLNDDMYVLGIHKETRNPTILLKYIEKGVLLNMTVIPIDPENDKFDFVLDSITMHNSGIAKFWKNMSNIYKVKTNGKL